MNKCPLFNSSRTQKIIGLSSFEAELHAIVSSASDGIYSRSVLDLALGNKGGSLHFYRFVKCAPAVSKRGVGTVRLR